MISFKILTEENKAALLNRICENILEADLEYAEDIAASLLNDGETEYALAEAFGCMLIRAFDGEYSFIYPTPLSENSDPSFAVIDISAYAVKEEIPFVLIDVPREAIEGIVTLFRHVNIDSQDRDNEYFTVRVMSEIALLNDIPTYNFGSMALSPITPDDDADYARLATDSDSNKYWGFDYREDEPNPEISYFRENAEQEFSRGVSLCLAIRAEGRFVGEATLYYFDLRGGCECAVRILPEFRRRGYAGASLEALKQMAQGMGILYLCASVDENNAASISMTEKRFSKIGKEGNRVKFEAKL